jgi:hypothetical protein
LESPLHIGLGPAGSLNRTRLYAPARALWGALAAEWARRQGASFPDYHAVGVRLREWTRLSYLFPAEQVGEGWCAWLPEYREERGLVWLREDGKGPVEDRVLRRWLLTTRPGTAIAPDSDTAEEGSLREYEVISDLSHWGEGAEAPRPVGLVGYIFLADHQAAGGLLKELLKIDLVFLGGDTRYGLGRLRRVEGLARAASHFFGEPVDLQAEKPVVTTARVLAHTVTKEAFCGALEYLAGWDVVSGGLRRIDLVWAPGSKSQDGSGGGKPAHFRLQKEGLWRQEAWSP